MLALLRLLASLLILGNQIIYSWLNNLCFPEIVFSVKLVYTNIFNSDRKQDLEYHIFHT